MPSHSGTENGLGLSSLRPGHTTIRATAWWATPQSRYSLRSAPTGSILLAPRAGIHTANNATTDSSTGIAMKVAIWFGQTPQRKPEIAQVTAPAKTIPKTPPTINHRLPPLARILRHLFRLCTTNTRGGALEFQIFSRRTVCMLARPFTVDSASNLRRRKKGDDEKNRMAVPPTWLNQLQAYSRVS